MITPVVGSARQSLGVKDRIKHCGSPPYTAFGPRDPKLAVLQWYRIARAVDLMQQSHILVGSSM